MTPGYPATMPPPAAVDYEGAVWLGARYYRTAARRLGDVRLVVMHSAECPIRSGAARSVARWLGGRDAPKASAHYMADLLEIVQMVREEDVAFGAGRPSHEFTIHIELAGAALSTDWTAPPGLDVLRRAAPLVADICARWQLPIEQVDADGVLAGASGITTHDTIRRALGGTCHCDPGGPLDKRWPWALWLELVRACHSDA